MAVSFDAASTAGLNGLSAVSINHTCSGSNRVLLCFLTYEIATGTESISSIFWNVTEALTFQGLSSNVTVATELWSLTNPTSGASAVDVTFSETVKARIGNMSFKDVDQSTPLDTPATAEGSSTAPTVNVLSVGVGAMVADGMGAKDNPTATVGANQTQRYNGTGGTGVRGAGSTEANGGTITMSWTLSASKNWTIVAVSVNAAATAAAEVIMIVEN